MMMSDPSSTELIDAIISRGKTVIQLSNTAYIFRAQIAFLSQHIKSFINSLNKLQFKTKAEEKQATLKQILELFGHYNHVLLHLQHDKWLQPAINWPVKSIPDYLDEFRKTLTRDCKTLRLNPDFVLSFDQQQDSVNKTEDFRQLRASLKAILAKADATYAEGFQEQIEEKLTELQEIIPNATARLTKRPSSADLPMVQMQHRVEELLTKYQNINIPLEDIKVEEQIGAGGFGTVSKATRLSTAEVVAVKELRSDRLTVSSWASLYAEIETMVSVKCNFVLNLVGAHITEPYRIITRFCSGKSLFDRLHRPNSKFPLPSPTHLTILAYEVACGMAYLHESGIVHRDLKTPNILLDSAGDCCVADFGLSGILPDSKELFGGVGTPNYTAPEVLSRQRYGPKVDVYSYGIVLWEMLTHRVPFADMTQIAIYEHVVSRGWRLPIPVDCPEGLKKLIIRCWSKSPADRPDFSEIVQSFEKNEIFFPGANLPDFSTIKSKQKEPKLNMDYLYSELSNPSNDHFSSIIMYISSRMTDALRDSLRQKIDVIKLAKMKINGPPVLLLASQLLKADEFSVFLKEDGMELFELCVGSQKGPQLSMAMRFGLAVPSDQLSSLEPFLPQIVNFLEVNYGNSSILQFLTRFAIGGKLEPYKKVIAKSLLDLSDKLEDQETFDSVATLFPLIINVLSLNERRRFYHLIGDQFVVSSSFVENLLREDDPEFRAELLMRMCTAATKSDITSVLVKFIQNCPQETLLEASDSPNFIQTCDLLMLDPKKDAVPLLFIFRVASCDKVVQSLANPTSLARLTVGKEHRAQKLQILTLLAMNEEFCKYVKETDSLFQLLLSSLSNKSLVHSAVQVIGAFSTHHLGCMILMDSGILDLFTQVFLSSQASDTTTTHTILRNLARAGCEIPQITLIVSCLMQDLSSPNPNRLEIMDTIVALVEMRPMSVQEHDLLRIAVHQLSESDPTLVFLSLKLLAVSDPAALRNIYPQILIAIHDLLNREELMYPEIIEAALMAIESIAQQSDLREFVEKTELERFVKEIVELLPEGDKRKEEFMEIMEQILIPPMLPESSSVSSFMSNY